LPNTFEECDKFKKYINYINYINSLIINQFDVGFIDFVSLRKELIIVENPLTMEIED